MRRLGVWLSLLIVLGGVFIFPVYWSWQSRQGVIPPGITLGGQEINGMSPADVEEQLRRLFTEPVVVYYENERLVLRAEDIGFHVKTRVMIGQARAMSTHVYTFRVFLAYLLGLPLPHHDVPLLVEWDPKRLNAWLEEVAQRYDRPPQPPQLVVEAGRSHWRAPAVGRHLNKNASIPRVIAAFKHIGGERVAHLVVDHTPPPQPDISVLQRALETRLAAFPGIASVFVRLLPEGEEAGVHANDIAYAGMSTMKIPILLLVYKDMDRLPQGELREWMRITISSTTGAGNYTANRILKFLGHGDPLAGAERVTRFLRSLGFQNSFIIAPYDWRRPPPRRVDTPANQNPHVTTYPDPLVQTTPQEIGLILAMIVECSQGKGALLAAYPDDFRPEECTDLLDLLTLNPVTQALLPAGLPQGTRYVHKHGYARDTHGDVAAVWGPEGPYVIALFLSTPNQWLVWDLSNTTFEDVSRLVWDFFALRAGKGNTDTQKP